MSLLTSSLLLKGGSLLLNALGKAKGGKVEQVTSALSQVIDAVKSKPEQQQLTSVASAIEQLPLEQRQALAEVEIELKRIQAEREQNQYQYDIAMHSTQQQTIQNGDNSQGEYTRQTRPKMARFSGYIGSIYVLLLELAHVFNQGDGANWQLAGLLFTPLLAYMGLRTWDAFSPYKGTKL